MAPARDPLRSGGTVRIDFHRTKYGRALDVDAAFVRHLPSFERTGLPHVLSFYDILLVTRGTGTFELDGARHEARPGALFFSRPGDLRRLSIDPLDGACVFFTSRFIEDAFRDPRFLDRFPFFRAHRPSGVLFLEPVLKRTFLTRFREMTEEIASLRSDADEALRAVLWELLVLSSRAYVARWGAPRSPGSPLVTRFLALVEKHFAREHRVFEYARRLSVSPGHLSAACRDELRESAGRILRKRCAREARMLLENGDITAADVGARLGFEDPAYFARFFRREVGETPSAYRTRRATSP
ncbi:MAG: helix-turn-helix domain-containing protein [Acidobacteria bacterium]|nr:helix-turn-helix domain-containing protein [Acidobacteriota bacterium]